MYYVISQVRGAQLAPLVHLWRTPYGNIIKKGRLNSKLKIFRQCLVVTRCLVLSRCLVYPAV
jgi:hypothetical protein